MRIFLHHFFDLLYHPFAFAYDLIAWVVSFGQWKNWILEVVPFIEGTRTLELGHGPGHLHRFLLNRGLVAVAIDESAAMSRLAKDNLTKDSKTNHIYYSAYAQTNITRGLGQQLPFCDSAFDTVLATFPAEYIFEPQTLSEVNRCLSDGGRFVVLPVAMPKSKFLSWLFNITGQAPIDSLQIVSEKMREPFIKSNFDVDIKAIEKLTGTLIVIIATKSRR